jgi:hypothetical protein
MRAQQRPDKATYCGRFEDRDERRTRGAAGNRWRAELRRATNDLPDGERYLGDQEKRAAQGVDDAEGSREATQAPGKAVHEHGHSTFTRTGQHAENKAE